MDESSRTPDRDDPHDLARFVHAQQDSWPQALRELRAGRKRSHWMWYVFPQLRGLGASAMSRRYAIGSIEEARAYLAHPLLGPRLLECCESVLGSGVPAGVMFGPPDDMKLKSCATLFAAATPGESVFARLLAEKFDGEADPLTLALLGSGSRTERDRDA